MSRAVKQGKPLGKNPRRLRLRGLPLVWALLVAPQLLLPAGSVICFETCGEWEITAEHASHSCDHANTSPHSGCSDRADHEGHSGRTGEHDGHANQLAPDHESMTDGESCLDLRPGDETTAAKIVAAHILALPVDDSISSVLSLERSAPLTNQTHARKPRELFGDCYLSPLKV